MTTIVAAKWQYYINIPQANGNRIERECSSCIFLKIDSLLLDAVWTDEEQSTRFHIHLFFWVFFVARAYIHWRTANGEKQSDNLFQESIEILLYTYSYSMCYVCIYKCSSFVVLSVKFWHLMIKSHILKCFVFFCISSSSFVTRLMGKIILFIEYGGIHVIIIKYITQRP